MVSDFRRNHRDVSHFKIDVFLRMRFVRKVLWEGIVAGVICWMVIIGLQLEGRSWRVRRGVRGLRRVSVGRWRRSRRTKAAMR